MPLPETGRCRRRDGDAAFLLLRHQSMVAAPCYLLANLVIDAGVEEDTLSRRRLASVDVRRDTDIAISLDGVLRATLPSPSWTAT